MTLLMGCQLHAPVACRGAPGRYSQLHRYVHIHTHLYTQNVGVSTVFAERSCAASGVYLPSMPTQAKLVQFSCVCESLLSEPEACLYILFLSCPFPCRLVHCFTCADMLPVQYSKFAGLGVLGTSYISRSTQKYLLILMPL